MTSQDKLDVDVFIKESWVLLEVISNASPNFVSRDELDSISSSFTFHLAECVDFLRHHKYIEYSASDHGFRTTPQGVKVLQEDLRSSFIESVTQFFGQSYSSSEEWVEDPNEVAPRSDPEASGSRNETSDGRYKINQAMGQGSFGHCFMAKRPKSDQVLTLKEAYPVKDLLKESCQQQIIKTVDQQLKLAARLHHPNIATIIDGNTSTRRPYFISHYLPGRNLRRKLKAPDGVDPNAAIKILLQALHALKHAHTQGVTHGGLKPENILFDSRDNAVITDFGLGLPFEVEQFSITRRFPGLHSACCYAAPEVIMREQAPSPATDLYSLGVVLYEMLAGELPRVLGSTPDKVQSDLPVFVHETLHRLLHPHPGQRFQAADKALKFFYSNRGSSAFLDRRSALCLWEDILRRDSLAKEAPAVKADSEELTTKEMRMTPTGQSEAVKDAQQE